MTHEKIRALAGHPDALPKQYIDWFENGYLSCLHGECKALVNVIQKHFYSNDLPKEINDALENLLESISDTTK